MSTFDADYYQRVYPDYAAQNPPRKLAFYASLVNRHLPASAPRRLHDVGCAFGGFLTALGPEWELYGSDLSEFALARARERLPQATFAVAGAGDAPFDQPFGAVTAFDVIEHVPDLDAVAQAVTRQLVPGGVLVFVVPVYDGLSGPLIRCLDKDVTHVHRWPRARWLTWAAEHFEVVEWAGILRYLVPGVKRYLHVPTHAGRGHTPAIAVVCRRGGKAG